MPRPNRELTGETGPAIVGASEDPHPFVRDERLTEAGRAKHLATGTPTKAEADDARESRSLSRRIAKRVSAKERDKLYGEHAHLVGKKMINELTPEEACRLDLVRWILDRIQDAEIGPEIDAFEMLAEMVGRTGKRVSDFVAESRKYDVPKPFFPRQSRDSKR